MKMKNPPEKSNQPLAQILIADDEPIARMAIARALELIGYRICEAASGEEALHWLARQPVDLLLLDLKMPELDGVAVMQQMQATYPHIAVIVLTGNATLESAIEAVKIGAADYLLKPCSIHEINAAVNRALKRRQEPHLKQRLIRVMQETLEALQEDQLPPLPTEPYDRCGALQLNLNLQQAEWRDGSDDGSPVQLTSHETTLLSYLIRHPEVTLSCRELAGSALGYPAGLDDCEAEDIVRPHISRLRQKLRRIVPQEIILTIRGKGYRLSCS